MPPRTNRFQQVVAIVQRHMVGDASVTESAMVQPRRGRRRREVDVVIESKIGQHTVRVSIEASKTERPATIEWVERMIGKHSKLPTDKLVLFSGKGFTPEALIEAAACNVVAIGQEPLEQVQSKVLAGMDAIWPKFLAFTPTQMQCELRRPDGGTWSVGPQTDTILFFQDGEEYPLKFGMVLSRKIHGQIRAIAEQINVRDIAESMESEFQAELMPFSVKIDDVEYPFFVRVNTATGDELQEIVCVRLRGRVKVDVQRVKLEHSRLGDVEVATGEFDVGDTSGVIVASSTGKMTMRFDPKKPKRITTAKAKSRSTSSP